MDKTDKKILIELQENGRITNAELAKRVGLSPAPCLERVKKLEKQGIIKGYYAKLDTEKIGIGVETFVVVTLSRHKHDAITEFIDAIQSVPEIIECSYITGRADFILRVTAENMKAYEDFLLHKLSKLPGLQHVETMMIMSNIKETRKYPINSDKSKD
ncbi:MAG: Lrp/AsnC family transcriptional regulator [Candidatus Marinimicrobia bacterium]|nr:Lrp/AsnC family transcriptional regulator [Candidatus Neomarinimicrobiota bacterium]MBL7108738.1 Lrp/AsnC family transcriptional regulator [Candidatus Neomarinimicrobiota bacterium]